MILELCGTDLEKKKKGFAKGFEYECRCSENVSLVPRALYSLVVWQSA